MTDKEIGKWFARFTVPHGRASTRSRVISLAHLVESTKYSGTKLITKCGRTLEEETVKGTLIEAPHEARCLDCEGRRDGSMV